MDKTLKKEFYCYINFYSYKTLNPMKGSKKGVIGIHLFYHL